MRMRLVSVRGVCEMVLSPYGLVSRPTTDDQSNFVSNSAPLFPVMCFPWRRNSIVHVQQSLYRTVWLTTWDRNQSIERRFLALDVVFRTHVSVNLVNQQIKWLHDSPLTAFSCLSEPGILVHRSTYDNVQDDFSTHSAKSADFL